MLVRCFLVFLLFHPFLFFFFFFFNDTATTEIYTLSLHDAPPTSGGSAGSTLTVHLSPIVTPTTFTLTVSGTFEGVSHTSTASVTVTVSSPAIADVVGQLLLAGCIDNAGIANALTAKLT